MAFHSSGFLVFLFVTFAIFILTPDRYRWLILLAASYFFYANLLVPYLPLLLLVVTVITYGISIQIERSQSEKNKKRWLWLGIVGEVIALIIFKYLPFLTESATSVLSRFAGLGAIPVPAPLVTIGLSFFIFQAISYLVDVYFETTLAEKHFGIFALYMAFFPKLLQGPIERASNLIPQFRKVYIPNYENLRLGALLFAWGMYKKLVIADRLKIYIDIVYSNVSAYNGINFILAVIFYSIYIYCDFSGYTDMALGTAQIFNIQLTNNFKRPYWAASIPEFWRRWHISFSSWLQDYLFTPLNIEWRKWRSWGTVLALLVTFFISGIWHGAGWGFILWGLIFGIYMVIAVMGGPVLKKAEAWLKIGKSLWTRAVHILVTFILVSLAWVFFGTQSVGDGWFIITHLFSGIGDTLASILSGFSSLGQRQGLLQPIILNLSYFDLLILIFAIPTLVAVDFFTEFRPAFLPRLSKNGALRWVGYFILAASIAFLGMQSAQQFVYFRF